jgi:Cof subfamily protein (haloacid dehalogenase superfamily)
MGRLLAESDFVSVHVPLTQETHHLLSTPQYGQMKKTAILINTSRGPVVDEAALVEALNAKKIAGAGLDVYEREPAVHPGLVVMPNVVLAPHIASATTRTRSEMSAMASRNMATAVRRAAAEPGQPRGQAIGLRTRYRLLALDLDGTIIDPRLNLDPRDGEALARIEAAGVEVIACTGRPFPGALPWVQQLGLDGPIICYQGAQVRMPDGETILDHGIAHDLALEVIRFARERDLHVQAYRDDLLLIERDRPEAHEYSEHAGMEIHVVGDLDEAMGPTTPKLVIVASSMALEQLLPEVRRRWAGRLIAATSMPTYLEFTSVESDKATALQFVCERLGVSQAETVAVGDGRNDASMIAWAGLGVAIEGSPSEVQAAADRTIPGPGHGGIKQLADLLVES